MKHLKTKIKEGFDITPTAFISYSKLEKATTRLQFLNEQLAKMIANIERLNVLGMNFNE